MDNIDKQLKDMRKMAKHLSQNKRRAKAFLMKVGIVDKDGKLTKEYGG